MRGYRMMGGCVLAALWLCVASPVAQAGLFDWMSTQLNEAEEAEVDSLVLPVPEDWIGDFDGMRERRLVRVLVPYSKTFFMVDRGRQQGISYELGKALEAWLNARHPYAQKSLRWQVMFIPVARNELMPRLLSGGGDIAAGGLTITEGRLQTVDFAAPFSSNIREAVITGPSSAALSTLEDLAGQEVTVRASSSYFEHLVAINRQFKARGLKPIKIIAADENLESEDLLEMLNAGLLNAIVVDRYIAEAWSPLYSKLQIHDEFYIHEGPSLPGRSARAVRCSSRSWRPLWTSTRPARRLAIACATST
ncbi:transporter substrate-binding domain-containing protein [Pseudomonas sp.]|uniref:transporter substrate-binding domain-containing protein n=1 Tax=Pseudomonas sp. TaxID=306 RepID=UPI00352336E7